MRIRYEKKSNDMISTKFIQFIGQNSDDRVETLYVDYPNKHIICYSTQIGCNQRCMMCYNGIKNNFVRDLTSSEITDQIINVIVHMGIYDTTVKPVLFSAMGIGEPLNNYDNYVKSVYTLHKAFPLAKFAVSTNGSNPENIVKLAMDMKEKDINLKLMISLHSADESVKSKIMPLSADLRTLLTNGEMYKKATGNGVEYNFSLMNGINDTDESAIKLSTLLDDMNLKDDAYIKINRFNQVSLTTLKPSTRVESFVNKLKELGVKNVEYYETNGSDISGACGQLGDMI